MAGEKKSVASLTLLADQPKQALEDLLAAETRVTEQGVKLATSFATGFETIEDRAKKALTTIANGGNAEAQLNKLVAEYSRLKTAQDAAVASGEKLPEEFQRAFSIAEKQITNVTAAMTRQREQTAELKGQFQQLAAAEDGVAVAAQGVATAEAAAAAEVARLAQVEKDAADAAARLRAEQEELVAQTKYLEEEAIAGAQSVDKMMAALREPGAQQPLEKEHAALVEVRSALERDITTYKEFGDAGSKAADVTRRKIEDVDRAIEKLGSEQKSFGQLTNNFRVTERVFDEFEQKVASGGPITARAIAPVIQNFERLKEQIQQTANVTPEMTARFAQLETRLKSVDTETRKSIDAMADHKVVLAEGGVQWTGFGNTLGIAAGKFGAVVSGAGAVGAALTAGIQIGNQFAHAIGTDFAAFDSFAADMKTRGAEIQSILIDLATGGEHGMTRLRAAATLPKPAMDGLNQALEAGVKDVDDLQAHVEAFNTVADLNAKIATAGTEGLLLQNKARKEGAGVLGEYILSLKLANDIAVIHNDLVSKGAEGQRVWNEIKGNGRKTLLEMRQAIEDHSKAIRELVSVTEAEVTAEKQLAEALNDTSTARLHAIGLEQQQAALVANQEKVEDGLTRSLRTKLAEITASMTVKEGKEIPLTKLQVQQLEEQLGKTVGLTDTERKHVETLIEKLKTVEQLTQVQRENLAADIQRELLINTTTESDERYRVVLDAKTRTISNAAAATDDLKDKQIEVKTSSDEAAEAATHLSGGFRSASDTALPLVEHVHAIGEGLQDFAKSHPIIRATVDELKKLEDQALRTAQAIQKASAAGLTQGEQ
jgi:chromosome segregation ATPase